MNACREAAVNFEKITIVNNMLSEVYGQDTMERRSRLDDAVCLSQLSIYEI
jgi:hypothetical protein